MDFNISAKSASIATGILVVLLLIPGIGIWNALAEVDGEETFLSDGKCNVYRSTWLERDTNVPKPDGTPMCLHNFWQKLPTWKWAPNGSRLGYSIEAIGKLSILTVDIESAKPLKIITILGSRGLGYGWRFSNSGSFIFYQDSSPSYGIGTKVYSSDTGEEICNKRAAPGNVGSFDTCGSSITIDK